ncbi:mediator of RNA polymerase II transcription subunit 8 [Olea europaea subsp. europaea]|uniref:Mediator of RNA polymerase II transcription subunit 8 n=1 Tax=Olea europaea subsp. europaea TaxID=158383 RepID=A0A8S0UR86_OLEEU|nr:mediator of RNA polymerase II transcription subunit 8 [Olea europaea subsp. europaea]
MEAPPPLPTPSAIVTTAEAPPRMFQPPTNINSDDSWNDPPLSKLRLMCSYGGHIFPRPHDKSLCYMGGDTRMIVIDRHTSLSDLHHRLSKTLLNNQPFTLKYQLPNEDLDSLISVSSDEDLECMVEEYDRLNNRNSSLKKSGRLRLFLFPKSSSIEHLLSENSSTKSEDWFLNVLNGKGGILSTAVSDLGFSDSSSINYLLGLDDDFSGKAAAPGNEVDFQLEGSKNCSNHTVNQDAHLVPDSPVVETSSSFGSTSSLPSVANLPPIRVPMEKNQKFGIEERFQQMNIGVVGGFTSQQIQESGGFLASAGTPVSVLPRIISGDYANPVFSGEKGSDHGGNKKEEQAQQKMQVQFQQKQGGSIELYSPESVSSEGSATNPLSRQRQTLYQEPFVQIHSVNSRVSANQVDPSNRDQKTRTISMESQVQESGYVLSGQFDRNHPPLNQSEQVAHVGATPVTSYYPMHSSQQQHHSHYSAHEQQYPVYFLPARPTQAYNMPFQQPSYSESTPSAASNNSQTPSAAYNQARNVPASNAEMAAGVYRTTAPQFLQVPSSQHQTQYVTFTQIHHPSQPVAVSSASNSNYAYEFADPSRSQVYYTQHLPPQLASHIKP